MKTRWYHCLAWFFGGIFLANTIPHLVNGISGSPFQSPFASPPGQGLSSSLVNVLWGMFNLAVGYVLVVRVGQFDLRRTTHVLVLGLGMMVMALMLAHGFARFHGGDLNHQAAAGEQAQASNGDSSTNTSKAKNMLHPNFPVIEGEYQMTKDWAVTLPERFNRRFEDDA